jgi:excisionase family DNA binding protein
MTSEEAAKAAGVSRVTINKWTRTGKLEAARIGKRGRLRIDPAVLDLVLAPRQPDRVC